MNINYSNPGKVVFSMLPYVWDMIEECPDKLLSGHLQSLAASHLFDVNEKAPKVTPEQHILFHHLTAKLLYLAKQTYPNLLLSIAFLATRVQALDRDDYKKLGQCMLYLKEVPKWMITLRPET
ncbi:hypothetical protein ACA910_005978 [Epithemia clementina (nom. ined.)]